MLGFVIEAEPLEDGTVVVDTYTFRPSCGLWEDRKGGAMLVPLDAHEDGWDLGEPDERKPVPEAPPAARVTVSEALTAALEKLGPEALEAVGGLRAVSTATFARGEGDGQVAECLPEGRVTAGRVRGTDGFTVYFFACGEAEALEAVGRAGVGAATTLTGRPEIL